MPTTERYQTRKRLGLCVRCGNRAAAKSVFCAAHRARNLAYQQRRHTTMKDDLPWALPGEAQPVRASFRAEPEPATLPPLPTTCPKCRAQLWWDTLSTFLDRVLAVRCVSCGYFTDRQMLQNKQDYNGVRHAHHKSGATHLRFFKEG